MADGTDAARNFLADVFPEVPAGLSLPVWTKTAAKKQTVWCQSTAEAAAAAERYAPTADVYFGVSLQDKAAVLAEAKRRRGKDTPPTTIRGYIETAKAIGGFWLDVDTLGPGHKSQRLPASEEEAIEWVTSAVPVQPTWMVYTGGGVQFWWLFAELWAFESDAERDRAGTMARRWVRTFAAHADSKGWDIDPAQDLARVLRVPGTFNRKPELGEPRPVRAERVGQGARYNPSDFEPHFVAEDETKGIAVPSGNGAGVSAAVTMPLPAPSSPHELTDRLAVSTLKYLTAGGRPNSRNNDLSRAAMDLAGCGVAKSDGYAMLVPRATADGLERPEIEATIESAWSRPRNPSKPIDLAGDDGLALSSLQRTHGEAGQEAEPATGKNGKHVAPGAAGGSGGSGGSGSNGKHLSAIVTSGGGRARISNVEDYIYEYTDKKGKKEKAKGKRHVPLPTIAEQIREATGGWPRRAGGVLFAVSGTQDDLPGPGDVEWFTSVDSFFAWVGKHCDYRWASGEAEHPVTKETLSPPTKSELFEYMQSGAMPNYRAIECLPHEPLAPAVFYLPCRLPKEIPILASGRTPLNELLFHLNPATEADRLLLLVMLMTPAWGGNVRKRPLFVVTSDYKQGSGKTTTVDFFAQIWGGYIDIAADEDWAQVRSRLLDEESAAKRICRLDNLKGKYNNANLEAALTAPVLDGKRMYYGQTSRPNRLTWYVTSNSPSVTKDLSLRAVVIQLGAPQHGFDFAGWAEEFIVQYRGAVIAEVLRMLAGPALGKISKQHVDRFGAWQAEVLCKLKSADALAKLINERRTAIDADAEDADAIWTVIHEMLMRHYPDHPRRKIFITRTQLYNAFRQHGQTDLTERRFVTWIKERCGTEPLETLRDSKHDGVRGFLYSGPDAPPTSKWDHILTSAEDFYK